MKIEDKLKFDVIGNSDSANICLIFIHGWKGNKDSFKRVAQSFMIKDSIWILPQAPYPLDEENSFSWTYEITPGKYERKKPIELLIDFFENEIFLKFNSRNVFLFGFSQGGLVCYEMLKLLDKPLGGVFPIAGFMGDTKKNIKRVHPSQVKTTIVIGHGIDDQVIELESSRIAYRLLSRESENISIYEYKGGHKIGFNYMKKIKRLIEEKFN